MKLLHKLLWFQSANTHTGQESRNVAKERLKLALTYDRGGLSRGTMEQLRDEIIQLIAKHLAINEEEIHINLDRTAEHDKLIASIPLTVQRPRMQLPTTTDAKKRRGRRRRRQQPRVAD